MKKITLLIAVCLMATMAHAAGGNITYELNGGITNDHGWSNKQDMYEGLNASWNTFTLPQNRTTWTGLEALITTWGSAELAVPKGIPTEAATIDKPFINDPIVKAEWQWLVDYMDAACVADSKGKPSVSGGATLRYNLSAFFFSSVRTGWPASPSYAVLGQPEKFIPSWGHAFAGPSTYDGTTEVLIPDPYKEDATFGGWYDNPTFTGSKITSIAIGEDGDKVLYAKWVEYIPTCEEVIALGTGNTSKTAGVVTFIDGNTTYIQDETAGLKLEFTAAPEIALGDKITITGTTASLGAYIEVIDATFLRKEAATLPAIQAINLSGLNSNTAAYMFEHVSIENLKIVSYGIGSVTMKDNAENAITILVTLDQSEFPINKKVDIEAIVSYDTDVVLVADPAKVTVSLSQDMSGTYKVGTTVGADFTTLKLAATAINGSTITGDVVLEITSNLEEPENIGLVFNSNFSLTIRPDADADRTITFNHAADDNSGPSGALCIGVGTGIAWADIVATKNVTIDGYAVGGSTKRLTIATAPTHNVGNMPILLLDDCSNIVIKNCIISHVGAIAGATGNYGIYMRVNAAQGSKKLPSNILIENNDITVQRSTASQGIGIYANAAPSAVSTGVIIKKNRITAVTRGLFLNYIDGIEIIGNEFRINQAASGNLSSAIFGNSSLSGNINIEGNKFIEFKTANSSPGAFGIRGIIASGGGTWNITNNFFTGFDKTSAAGETMLVGIRCGSTCFINHNTFYLNALTNKPAYVADPTDAISTYAAISIAAGSPEIKHNIFVSDEDAVYNYAVRGTIAVGTSSNNIFDFKAGTTMASANSAYPNFANFVASDVAANSKIVTVNFADAAAGDLSIAGASIQDQELEVPLLTSVLFDIFGKERAELTYAGAHESVLPFITIPTSISEVESTARIITTATGVQVELDGEANIELYNVNGKLLDKARVNGSYSRELNKGIYIIRINGKGTKFIK